MGNNTKRHQEPSQASPAVVQVNWNSCICQVGEQDTGCSSWACHLLRVHLDLRQSSHLPRLWCPLLWIEGNDAIFVFSGCYSRMSWAGGLINDGNFFLMVLGNLLVQNQVAGKFCGWWELTSWFIVGCLPSEGARDFYGVAFIRTLIPFMRASPEGRHYLLKAPPPNTITLEINLPTYEFCRDINLWSGVNDILKCHHLAEKIKGYRYHRTVQK